MMTKTAEQRGIEWLQTADVRATKQRVALATLLVGDGNHRHVCAESLHAAVRKTGASVSLATVYNTLRTFSDAGLVNEITVDGQKSYFDTRIDEHPHYYWEDDAKLTDAPKDAVKLTQMSAPPQGTEVTRMDVVIRLRKS